MNLSLEKRSTPPPDDDLLCPECDYNLKGTTGDRCPWCGWAIDLDTLVRAADRPGWRRIGVIVSGAVAGGGSLLAVAMLAGHQRPLSLSDGLAVLGVVLAAAGHLGIAVLALLSRSRWPIRHREARRILTFAVVVSLLTGVAGAARFLSPADRPELIRGVTVTSVFEFSLAAVLFTLPAWSLLVLRLVSFEETQRSDRSRDRTTPADSASLPARALFVVETFGRYRREQLTQSWRDSPRPTTPEIERWIEETWSAEVALAAAHDRMLYNGHLVRLISARGGSAGLNLELGPTTYREFVGTNVVNAARVLAVLAGGLADPLGVSATIITQDGFLAFGRRSERVAYHPGFLHPFGGMLEAADRLAGGAYDVFGSILRELREEVNLEAGEIAEMVIAGLVRDRALYQPELLFDVTIRLTRTEFAAKFSAAADSAEHTGIEFVPDEPEAVLPFLDCVSPVTPVAEAAMLLHGRHMWGTEWYDQTCYVRYGELPPLTQSGGIHAAEPSAG